MPIILPTTLHDCMRDKWRHLGGKHISSYADGEEQLHGTSFAMKGFEILEPTYLQVS